MEQKQTLKMSRDQERKSRNKKTYVKGVGSTEKRKRSEPVPSTGLTAASSALSPLEE